MSKLNIGLFAVISARKKLEEFRNTYIAKIDEIINLIENDQNWIGPEKNSYIAKLNEAYNNTYIEYLYRLDEFHDYLIAIEKYYSTMYDDFTKLSQGAKNLSFDYESIMNYTVNYGNVTNRTLNSTSIKQNNQQ